MFSEGEPNPSEVSSETQSGFFTRNVFNRIEGIVTKPHALHNEIYDYDSTVSSYGYTLKMLEDDTMIFDPKGIKNKFDRWGDSQVRPFDDHLVQEPDKMKRMHPKLYKEHSFLGAKPKRSRGEADDVVANAQRLGMGELYKRHPQGIEIVHPEIYTRGINMADIYSVDNPTLGEIDRNHALKEIGSYVRNIHDQYGAIGEIHPIHFFFQKKEGSQVSNPQMGVPDIVFNPKIYPVNNPEEFKKRTEPKAVEILDFMWSSMAQELKKTNSNDEAKKLMDSFLSGYQDPVVIDAVRSLARRGRVTVNDNGVITQGEGKDPKVLPDSVTTRRRALAAGHNDVHLGVKEFTPERLQDMRSIIIDECSNFLDQSSQSF